MTVEDDIKKALESSPFGLTKEEIARKTSINEATAYRMLERMTADYRIKKTKGGKTVFYSIPKNIRAKYIPMFLFFIFILSSPIYASNLSSENFTIAAEVSNAGGGLAVSSTYNLLGNIGDITGDSPSASYSICAGLLCSFLEFITTGKVTFLLEFNISGNENDTGFVDNFTQYRQYRATNLINYYACTHDVNVAGSPAFGIIFAGSKLNYINLSSGNSFVLRISQDVAGNKFILPITSGNCTVFTTRLSQITQFGTILQPFVLGSEVANAVELSLGYPAVDIVGQFQRSGSFTLIVEKNDTSENQIIIKPA